MKLIIFYVSTTIAYCIGTVYLLLEYKHSSAEKRKELETIPLLMSTTVVYLVAVLKTRQLAAIFQ